MRASSHSPYRTLMMFLTVIVVAVLASLGGYHYHTFAASQMSGQIDPDFSDKVVLLNESQPGSASLTVDQLFPEAPQDEDAPIHVSPEPPVGSVGGSAIPNPPHSQQEPDLGRSETDDPEAAPRRFPSSAMTGWQFADERGGANQDHAAANHVRETSAAGRGELNADDDLAGDGPTARSGLQSAIDRRRQHRGSGRSGNRMVAVAPVSLNHAQQQPARAGHSADVMSAAFDGELSEEEGLTEATSYQETVEATIDERQPKQEWRDPRNLKEATEILREWGIRKYKLVAVAEGSAFLFSCSVTELDNPRARRRFLAEGDEPITAVRKVLRQIEDWRAKQ